MTSNEWCPEAVMDPASRILSIDVDPLDSNRYIIVTGSMDEDSTQKTSPSMLMKTYIISKEGTDCKQSGLAFHETLPRGAFPAL